MLSQKRKHVSFPHLRDIVQWQANLCSMYVSCVHMCMFVCIFSQVRDVVQKHVTYVICAVCLCRVCVFMCITSVCVYGFYMFMGVYMCECLCMCVHIFLWIKDVVQWQITHVACARLWAGY